MEITLKQVETLRDRAGVSEAEAREALERNGGDLLEALLDLERLGKSHTSGKGGFYSTQPKAGAGADALVLSAPAQGSGADRRNAGNHLGTLWRALLDLFQRTLSNQFEVWRGDRMTTSMPVLVLVLLTVFFFWITVPLLVVGLLFGYRYRFGGPDLDRESVDRVMRQVSDTVTDVTDNVRREWNKRRRKGKK